MAMSLLLSDLREPKYVNQSFVHVKLNQQVLTSSSLSRHIHYTRRQSDTWNIFDEDCCNLFSISFPLHSVNSSRIYAWFCIGSNFF